MGCSRMLFTIAVSLLACGLTNAAAVSSVQSNSIQSEPANVIDFVTPDGRVDREALVTGEVQDPLKLNNIEVRIDPVSGEPIARSTAVSVFGHPDDMYWRNEISSYLRIDGSVRCAVVYEGQLILGGTFTHAGVLETNHVVSWDGQTLSPLGMGTNDTVSALAVYDGRLIVAGSFDSAGGNPASHIASWDGSSWSALGVGINGNVMSLTVSNNTLVAGGDFAEAGGVVVHSLAQWDGTVWSAMGDNLSGRVNTLIVYDGMLYAGGSFVIDSDSLKRNLAYWDSDEWRSVADSLSIPVISMVIFDDKMIVGGYQYYGGWGFAGVNGLLASWDGSNWVDILSNLGNSHFGYHNDFGCTALGVHDDQLLAGGFFSHGCIDGTYNEYSLMGWNGTSWNSKADGLVYPGIRIMIDYEGDLIAGGQFWSIDGVIAFWAAILKGSDWYQLGGLEYRGTRLSIFDGKLISAGRIVNGSSNYGNDYHGEIELGAWDGSSWSDYEPRFNFSVSGDAIGGCGGVYPYPPNPYPAVPRGVYGSKLIIVWPESYARDQLYTWDKLTVSQLNGLSTRVVKTLTTYHDKLIVTGDVQIGDYKGIAMWDGSTWSDMGISREDFISVFPAYMIPVLTVFDDMLVLNSSAETDHKLQVWDGTTWSYLGTGEQASIDSVRAMTTYNNALIAGGSFSTAGGFPANNIAFWNGDSWQPLDEGLNGPVTALTVYNGRLIAGGNFTEAGGQPANNIAAWDGSQWSPLGSGVNGEVWELLVYHNGLVVSGQFSLAGGKLSPFISLWTEKNNVEVAVDIRPGSCPNPINGNSAHGQGKAVLPVAIMGTADFYVHDIDLATVTLNGSGPVRWNYEDVGTPPDDPDEECACSEAGPDGYTDLTLKFYSAEVVASLGGDNVVRVEGQFLDGTSFEGQDCVVLVGNGNSKTASDGSPVAWELQDNYPNPFNPSTSIAYNVVSQSHVIIEIFDILGRKVRTLVDDNQTAGSYRITWDSRDADGTPVASGIYFYRLLTDDFIQTKKMLLLK